MKFYEFIAKKYFNYLSDYSQEKAAFYVDEETDELKTPTSIVVNYYWKDLSKALDLNVVTILNDFLKYLIDSIGCNPTNFIDDYLEWSKQFVKEKIKIWIIFERNEMGGDEIVKIVRDKNKIDSSIKKIVQDYNANLSPNLFSEYNDDGSYKTRGSELFESDFYSEEWEI